MLVRLFLLFTLLPAVELYLLLRLGGLVGPIPTFLIVLATGVIGAQLARQEGHQVLMKLQEQMSRGQPPARQLVEGVLVFAGGLLLVTPGILTDFVGFSMIVPGLRPRIASAVMSWAAANVELKGVHVDIGGARYTGPPPDGSPAQDPAVTESSPFDHPTA